MKLRQMTRTKSGQLIHYRSPVSDRKGRSHYEVSINGPSKVVEKALAEVDLAFDIDPDASPEEMNRRAMEIIEPYHRELAKRIADPEAFDQVRPPKKLPLLRSSRAITVSLRPTGEHGTFWFFDTLVPVPLPGPIPFQVVFPPCFAGGAMSMPVAGNPNVLIRFNSPIAPLAAASTLPGLAVDVAPFALAPWVHVIPFFQFVHAAPVVTRMRCWGFSLLPF